MRVVIVSRAIFTRYLFEPDFGVVDAQSKTVYALDDWQHAVTLTTPEDIGRLTAEIFFHRPAFHNEAAFIAGDTLTYSERADLMRAHWGNEINRKLLDGQKLQNDVQHNPQDLGAKYRLTFARTDGEAWSKEKTFNHRKGIATTTAAKWLAKHHSM